MLLQRKILQVPNPTFGGLVMALLSLDPRDGGIFQLPLRIDSSRPGVAELRAVAMYAVVASLGASKRAR